MTTKKVALAIEFSLEDSFPQTANPCDAPRSGVVGFVGWHRVADALRFFGAVRDDESVTHIVVTDRGLEVFTAKRKKRLTEYLPAKQQGSRK